MGDNRIRLIMSSSSEVQTRPRALTPPVFFSRRQEDLDIKTIRLGSNQSLVESM
ncbi:hypothetical protein CY34DRAFT_813042 [Suillus luteus UH-Slu-Lm8-n1]|uniref:Uncharacterized protein n=1 Tax=Suillus luteus UH-Slu-Lm8-n1 TaxID=930992 RepID=A0A0D0AQI1_9AGAM|nr:hypothetical protein CY34DRAFT_813042 [Suillus luteus UH-Slu-Lm8-n1]